MRLDCSVVQFNPTKEWSTSFLLLTSCRPFRGKAGRKRIHRLESKPDQDRGLAQLRRVLKPGGCLAISTWKVAHGADLHPILKEIGISPSRNPSGITEPDILEALILCNGFTGISVKMNSMDFRYANAEEVWQTGRGTGMRRTLDTLDATQKQRALRYLLNA